MQYVRSMARLCPHICQTVFNEIVRILLGFSDSGWFLDRDPYVPTAIAAADVVKLGYNMWGGDLPEACTSKHANEPWRCYFGHRLYPTLTCKLTAHSDNHMHDLYVFQFLTIHLFLSLSFSRSFGR